MKAIGYKVPGPIAADAALVDINLPRPVAAGYDILVEVKAVSVNPVDYKVRNSTPPADGDWKVLGWDAARIVGHKPASLSWAEAAALPLTTLTAWEAMFDRLDVAKPVPGAAEAILIIGGAGGVGSIAVQIARQRTDLTVIATASRPETQEWVRGLGAHHVIDHSRPLAPQIAELGIGAPAFVFSTTHTEQHVADIAELIAPQGRFGLIDDPKAFDIMVFKRKAVSIHHELMFTRSIYGTPDMNEQGEILDAMAALVDDGKIRTTLTRRLSPINAANLKTVHALIESGAAKGKIVLEGF